MHPWPGSKSDKLWSKSRGIYRSCFNAYEREVVDLEEVRKVGLMLRSMSLTAVHRRSSEATKSLNAFVFMKVRLYSHTLVCWVTMVIQEVREQVCSGLLDLEIR